MVDSVHARSFHVVDYAVFGLALLLSLSIGVYHAFKSRNAKSNKEYLVGDGQLSLLPVAVSIIVSIISGAGLLGTPAEVYAFGTQYFLHVLGAALGNLMAIFLFVPLLYPLKYTSCYEYLEHRYKSQAVRLLANLTMLGSQLLFNAVGIVAPSIALQAVTGIPVGVIIVVCGTTATVYTCIGGMKAVIWTDVFQSIFIFAGLVALTIVGTVRVGGFYRVWELNNQWHRLEFFNLDPDPTKRMSFWSVVFCMSVLYLCLCCVQSSVQRYCSLPNIKMAKMSLVLNIFGLALGGTLACMVGTVAFAYYADIGCDPLASGKIRNPNQILPYFVLDVLTYPGLPGLFVACIACAALSTASSSMNACATMIWQDLLSPLEPCMRMSETSKTRISKGLVCMVGVISICLSFAIKNMKGTFVHIILSLAGSIIGPTTGLFILGAANPKAGKKAAIIALLVALSFNGFLNIGARLQRAHVTPLPSPTENCKTQLLPSHNMSAMDNMAVLDMEIISLNDTLDLGRTLRHVMPPGEQETPNPWRKCLDTLFSISYLYYPLFGLTLVLLIGTLLSLLPGMEFDHRVEDSLLFPCIAYLRAKWSGYRHNINQEDTHHAKCTCPCTCQTNLMGNPAVPMEDVNKEPKVRFEHPLFVHKRRLSQAAVNVD